MSEARDTPKKRVKDAEIICRGFDVDPVLVLGDYRSRLQKLYDRMPWSWYARSVRRWRREFEEGESGL